MNLRRFVGISIFIPALITFSAVGCSDKKEPSEDYISYKRPAASNDTIKVKSLDELQKAINEAPSDGRVIILLKGTYEQFSTINITDKYNITIRGETDEYKDTAIKGPGMEISSMPHNITVNNSKYVTIQNMTLQDSYYHAVQVNKGSDYFYAFNLKTWDNGESGFKVTSSDQKSAYSDFGMIENCYIGFTTAGQREVIEGIDIVGGKGWIIRGNTVVNIKHPNNIPDQVAYGIFAKGNSQDTIIERNLLKDCDLAISFGGGGTGLPFFRDADSKYEHRNGIIRNNIVWGTKDTGIYMNKAINYKVYNNTIWSSKDYQNSIESRFSESSGEISNNICSMEITDRDGGKHTGGSNITNAPSNLFENAEKGDFHLKKSAKVAINKGKVLKKKDVSSDFADQHRPKGSSFDIGAYEK